MKYSVVILIAWVLFSIADNGRYIAPDEAVNTGKPVIVVDTSKIRTGSHMYNADC